MLEKYSNKWGIDLNLSKTKIMILNKQGATSGNLNFTFKNKK